MRLGTSSLHRNAALQADRAGGLGQADGGTAGRDASSVPLIGVDRTSGPGRSEPLSVREASDSISASQLTRESRDNS